MKIRLLLAACLVCVGTSVAATSWAASAKPGEIFSTPGEVVAIAADGRRVAIATSNPKGCDRVVVWTAATVASQGFDSRTACEGAVLQGIPEVAIAGTRVEWVATTGGNLQEMSLEAAQLGKSKVSVVATARNEGGAAGGVDGSWTGHLYGDGSLLVFNTWNACSVARLEGGAPCEAGTRAGDQIDSRQTLWKLVGVRKTRIAAGPGAFAAVAVSNGRIAVESPSDGGVSLLSAAGATLPGGAITAGTGSGTTMQGNQLVTLRNGTLQAYNTGTGHLDASVSLPAGGPAPLLRDVEGGIATYVRGRQVHAVRLSDGKDATFVAPGKGKVDAQIEPAGLYYSYNLVRSPAHGRVVFVPAGVLAQTFP